MVTRQMIGLTEVLMVWVGGRPADSVYPHPESRASRKSRIHKIAQLRERTWLPFRDDCGEVRGTCALRSDLGGGYKLRSSTTKEFLQSTIPQLQSTSTTHLTSQPFIMYSVRGHILPLPHLACADHRCAPIDHRRPEERCLRPELLQLRRDVSIAYIEEGLVAHLLF